MKHAYLIMAHDHPRELKELISALDYPENGIYVHIDARSSIDLTDIEKMTSFATIHMLEQKKVAWGGSSQIDIEMDLFSKAYSDGGYRYYHLLSGVDYPTKSHEYIMNYFTKHDGENFISLKDVNDNSDRFRMRYEQYHLLQNILVGKKRNIWKYLDFASCYAQRFLGIRRFRNQSMKRSINWVSITDEVVGYLIENEKHIRSDYKWTYCCDEVFLLSEIWNTSFRDTISSHGNLRFIEWRWVDKHDSSPRLMSIEDKDKLSDPDILFARKFQYPESSELVKYLKEEWSRES